MSRSGVHRAWWGYGHDQYKWTAARNSINPRGHFQRAHMAILPRLGRTDDRLTASMKAWLDVFGRERDSDRFRAYRHRGVRSVSHVDRADGQTKDYKINCYRIASLDPNDEELRSEVWRAFSDFSYQGREDGSFSRQHALA